MDITNNERVRKALDLLKDGLRPYVERELRTTYKDRWEEVARQLFPDRQRRGKGMNWDNQALLKVMCDLWRDCFSRVLGPSERSLVSELRAVRNNWAHQSAFSTDDAYRAIDTVSRLLAAISAGQVEALEHMKGEILRFKFEEQIRSQQPVSAPKKVSETDSPRLPMLSNTERGKAFQILCRDALTRVLNRDLDMEVPLEIGGGKLHFFDLATGERDVVSECKAFTFTKTGNIPAAKITTLREAAMYLRSAKGTVLRLLIVKYDQHPKRGETLGGYFVRLNAHHLEQVTVLEMKETGGDLVCIHGSFDARPSS